jgi:uncharacterized protein (UPF0332 family)
MTQLSFRDEIVEGSVDDLADIISLRDQDRFCRKTRMDFQRMDKKTFECSVWGWRCFKAMRSLLFSAALYVESLRAKRNKFLEAIYCYGLYYSMFHASFALVCMHPRIQSKQLLHISHKCLINLILDKFIRSKVLPKSFPEIVERARVMREVTSYFAPLGGLSTSTSPDIKDVNLAFEESRKHLAYSFQLCNLLGSIYWKVKNDCSRKNKTICQTVFEREGEKIGDHIEKLINYQPFPGIRFWPFGGELEFDDTDAWTAVRKFRLYEICPRPLLRFMTLEVGTEEIHIESDATHKAFIKFITNIW